MPQYKAEVNYFTNDKGEGLSRVGLTLIMNYDDWKQTFSENLARYRKELGIQDESDSSQSKE